MKSLYAILLITVMVNSAQALECGESKTSSTTEESKVEVTTNVPKFLEGSTITLTKADGSKEVLKAEEYMIVKRKHTRPVVKQTIKQTSLACTKVSDTNIVSLKAVDGYSDVETKKSGATTTLSVERQVGVGLQYQRAIKNGLYLGGEVDSNKGVGVSVGVGF